MSHAPPVQTQELRCCCNRLLARVEAGQVVLRCPRCKREALLQLGQQGRSKVQVQLKLQPTSQRA